jgi:hypothetical protein
MRRFQLPLLGSNQDSPDPESGVLPVTPRGSFVFSSYGAEGDRTPDLLIANEALSQLSYSPTKDAKTTARPPFGQPKNRALPEPIHRDLRAVVAAPKVAP